ncbi:MAG: endonuclease MutS2, partial [Flavobacteriales bacterium]
DRLLNELQKEKSYLNKLNKEHIIAQDLAQEALINYTERKEYYDYKLKGIRENSEDNQHFINAGKKLLSYVSKYNLNTKKKVINNNLLEEIRKYLAVEKTKVTSDQEKGKLKKINNSKNSKQKTNSIKTNDSYGRDKIKF